MKNWYSLMCALMLGALSLCGESPAHGGDATSGKKSYTKAGCFGCHGSTGQGGPAGPKLVATKLTLKDFQTYVRKPTKGMPAFSATMVSDAALKEIYTFLKKPGA